MAVNTAIVRESLHDGFEERDIVGDITQNFRSLVPLPTARVGICSNGSPAIYFFVHVALCLNVAPSAVEAVQDDHQWSGRSCL
ncbi:MAG: hypothetical protein ABR598_03650 [Candidatus Dormibacteria bacterium]